jgi:hypothetical protein
MQYILEGKNPVKEEDWLKWAKSGSAGKRAALDRVGESVISTVFIGVDYSDFVGRPLLFETMVFGGELDGEMERCSTWEEAELQHKQMVDKVKYKKNEIL